MKKTKVILLVCFLVNTLNAQVSTNFGSTTGSLNVGNSTFSYDQGGSIILAQSSSTAQPYFIFRNHNSTAESRFYYLNNKLCLVGSRLNLGGDSGLEFLASDWGNGFGSRVVSSDEGSGNTYLNFDVRNNSQTFSSALKIHSNGKVGLGFSTGNHFPTSSGAVDVSNYKLFVKGGILTEEVRVSLNSTWADYVFKNDYKLPSLTEVENHIKENGHLINVPSAKEVKENGIEMGEMFKIQQEKIEELTLYIIELNKTKEKQNALIEKLEARLNKLENK